MARDMLKMVERLNDLIALDADALYAYEAAIKRIHSIAVRDELRAFQEDHRRHIRDLTEAVERLGGRPRERRDMKGFILQGFTPITAEMGDEAALKAMRENEKVTNRTYQRAGSEGEWPAEVQMLLTRNFSDEQRHLRAIEEMLRARAWEQPQPAQP